MHGAFLVVNLCILCHCDVPFSVCTHIDSFSAVARFGLVTVLGHYSIDAELCKLVTRIVVLSVHSFPATCMKNPSFDSYTFLHVVKLLQTFDTDRLTLLCRSIV